MRRNAPGYRSSFAVVWFKRGELPRESAPRLMGWAVEVARRMRARGHFVQVVRV